VWVGGWWIGFVIMSIVCFLLAIPILAYPKSLPGSENLQKTSEAHGGSEQKRPFTKIREIPKALANLLKNPTFFFLNLAGATEGLIISGFAVFLPKQIENQFSVTAVYAALLMGK
jgi:organic anion transporter 4A